MSEPETIIQITNLSYRPTGADTDVLNDLSLSIRRGDFVLLLGPSGCGKSTLTRCLNGLIPHLDEGDMRGSVTVLGKDTASHSIYEFASRLGLVFQNPDDQILSLKVVDEVAWGVENLGLSHEEIVSRVDEYMDACGISDLKERLTFAISGGQKQKVSIASNLAMRQEVLVLDDPTTDLDPVCKADVVQTLRHLHHDMGMTLIVIEHDLNDLIELANRVVVLDDGHLACDGPTAIVMAQHYDDLMRMGVNMPQHIEVAHAILDRGPKPSEYPVLKEEVFALLQEFMDNHPHLPSPSGPPNAQKEKPPEVILSVRDLDFAYDPGVPVLRRLSFDIVQGEFVAIIGANGSGKSTLVNALTGLLAPDEGEVIINGHNTKEADVAEMVEDIGYVFQNPDHQLIANTVEQEVAFSLRTRHVPDEEVERLVEETLAVVDLEHLRERHPFSLSRGQRQKLAVATALVHKPTVMLLDEPTTGQDRRSLSELLELMAELNRLENTTIMVTHDMDIVAAYASRVLVMADGQIVMDGRPEDVFYDQFEALANLNLRPPTVVDYCRRLADKGMPRFLVVDQLVDFIAALDD